MKSSVPEDRGVLSMSVVRYSSSTDRDTWRQAPSFSYEVMCSKASKSALSTVFENARRCLRFGLPGMIFTSRQELGDGVPHRFAVLFAMREKESRLETA